jgi:2-oxoglutarate ferredoxin oxidoreductase subunit beta
LSDSDTIATLTKKDFTSDQEVRWCPGCGDYAILSAVQGFMPEHGIEPHETVFVSGIGCSGRFTYYMDTYGVHGIHGRAPAIATGIATANPRLNVFVVTGDGDGLSIGGNHLIHALRRNVNLKILMFNNQIYGLTKGQYSPTSEEGKVTKSTPFGSVDHPFNPIALALGAEATFVARTVDNDRAHLTGNRCVVVGENGRLQIAATSEVAPEQIVVHDVDGRPSLPFALAHLSHGPTEPTCIGVFREFERPVYGEAMTAQLQSARERQGAGDLSTLLHGGDTWSVP